MKLNPRPRPGGGKPAPTNDRPPTLNPEIDKWFQDRQRRRKVVHTTITPGGQTLDWIRIESQVPGGKIATPPPAPRIAPPDDRSRPAEFDLENPRAERGPAGTVPVVRKNLAALHETTSLKEYLSKRGGLKVNPNRIRRPQDPNPFEYFHATSQQSTNTLGCSTWLNIWDPYVETSTDHSLVRSCPVSWCNWRGAVIPFSGVCRVGQAVTADSLTIGSSLNGAMVSSVM